MKAAFPHSDKPIIHGGYESKMSAHRVCTHERRKKRAAK
jgi:hypothetical protein